jgi:hypothetical protein
MKIRTGFVSNSSSSSFLMYGLSLDCVDPRELSSVEDAESLDSDGFDLYEELEGLCKGTEFGYWVWDDYAWIGASWDEVGDDETGRQFKEKVEASLRKALGDKYEKYAKTLGTHSEAWRDG